MDAAAKVRINKCMLFCCVILLLFACSGAAFASWTFVDVSLEVLQPLNELRRDPVGFAWNAGVTAESLVSVWGNRYGVLEGGLQSLAYAPELAADAENDLRDMLRAGELRKSRPFERAEVVIAMAFENNMSRQQALSVLLFNASLRALEADPVFSNLLFPIYNAMGAVLGVGSIEIDGQTYNVYVLVVELAAFPGWSNGCYVVGSLERCRNPVFYVKGTYEEKLPVMWPNGLFFVRCEGKGLIISADLPPEPARSHGIWDLDISGPITFICSPGGQF